MELVEAGSIQLDKPEVVERGAIQLDAKPPEGFIEDKRFVQGKPAPFSIKDIFREDPAKLRAKASNAMAYSEWFNLSPSQAYEFHDEISEQLGGEHLTTPELIGGLLTLPIAAGLASNPVGVLLGLGTFEAIGEVESAVISFAKGENYKIFQKQGLKDLLPDDTSRMTSDIVDIMDFVGKVMVAKSAFKRTPKIIEKVTKQIIEEHKLPKSVFIDPKELKAELQTGGVLGVNELDIVKGLGLKGSEYRQAIKNGIHIEISTEKITTIRDRPWFAKVKELFKIDPAQPKTVRSDGKTTYRFGAGATQEVPGATKGGKLIGEDATIPKEPIAKGGKAEKPIAKGGKAEKPPVPTEEPITEYEIGELNKVDKEITAQASRQAEINVYKRLEKGKAKDEAGIRKVAGDAVSEVPIYKAMAEIKMRGGLNLKKLSKDWSILDRTALTRKYPGIISKTGEVALDEIADELGFESDTALMDEMLDAPTKGEAVQKQVDEFYSRYYDEMMGGERDVLGLIYAEESKLLKEATKKYKIKPAKGLKKFIREETGQVKVKEIIEVKPGEIIEYAMKEAQKAARIAFRAGDRAGLAKAKAKYREALEKKREREYMRNAVKKMVGGLKKIDIEKLSPHQAAVVGDLLRGLDLSKPMKKTMLKLTATREYLENNPEAEIPDYVMERLGRLDKKNLHDITLEELESIHDAVLHQVHLSKLKNKIRVRRKLKEETEVLKDSIAEMKPRKEVTTKIVSSQQGDTGSRKNIWKLIKDTFGIRHDHYDLIIESLAGINSTMHEILYKSIDEGADVQLKYKHDFYKHFQREVDKIGIKDISKWLIEEIKTGKFKLTRNERMALYGHSKNPDNRRAIIEGGFGFRTSSYPNRVFKMTESELNDIIGSLTKEEMAFADIWDGLSEDQYKSLNKVFLEKNRYNLPKEESYYPKDTMPLARGKDFESEEALDKFKGTWTRIGIEKGMLEKRRRVQLPIYLNSFTFDVNKSVMKTAAYVGLELPLSNASKLLYNKDFRRELSDRYGNQTWIEIEKGLRDIAGDWQSYTTVEEIALKLKNNLTTAILGLNPFVMAKQILSYAVYLPYIKSGYLVQGFMDYHANQKEIDARHEAYSPKWTERVAGGYSRDVADIFKGGSEKRLYDGKFSVKESIMGGIKLFDHHAVGPGMHAAVLQVLDEFKAGELSEQVRIGLNIENSDIGDLTAENKMRLAYRYADLATVQTQPMFSLQHRSSLSRGATVEKLATMFGAFTNQALNLTRRTWREAQRTGNYEPLAAAIFTIFILNTMGVMAIDEIRNRIYKRDAGSVYGRILNSWAGYVFFLRDLASSVISKIERGTFMGYDVSWPISKVPQLMSDIVANGVGMMTEKNQRKRAKMAERFVDDSLNLILMLNGIPYQTPKKLIEAGVEAVK